MSMYTKTKQGLLIATAVCVLMLGGAVWVYITIVQTHATVESLRDTARVASRDDVVSLKRAIRAFNTHRDVFERTFIKEKDVFSFIDAVESLGEHFGATTVAQQVVVEDVARDGTTHQYQTVEDSQRSHGTLTLTLRADGSWESVMKLLLALEQLPRAMRITDVRFNALYDQKTQTVLWSALFETVTIIE